MEMNSHQYKLRCQLRGHNDDVRGLCVCGEAGIASVSRDSSVCFWTAEKGGYVLKSTLVGHSGCVGAVAWLPNNEEFPGGGLVSGGSDGKVLVWDLRTGLLARELTGHELQVTSVTVNEQGDVLSASGDSHVRRWTKWKTVEVLKGHAGPVHVVLALPSGEVLTGSRDSTIKVWRGSSCVQTLVGHADTVRGLAFLPSVGIVSGSHDCTIRLWASTGEVLQEMVGHSGLVYSVAVHSSGEIASASEDTTAKIWRDGVCCQSIDHPGCVWDVKYLPNGDLVTACSDGVARVWTLDYNSPLEIETPQQLHSERQNELSSNMMNTHRKMFGGMKLGELPAGIEALQQAAKSFVSSSHPSWSTNRHLTLEDLEGEDEMRPDFSCPYCYEDFDITSLCAHLEDEHCFETKAAICPVCVAKIGKDVIGHITLQHGHLFKMQRRRKFKKAGPPSTSTLSLLGKELREAHLQALLGGGSRSGSMNPNTTDPLLLSLVYSLPIPEAEESSKSSVVDQDTATKGTTLQPRHSSEASLTTEERQRRWQQSQLRAKFVQQLMLSTLLKDS